MNRRILCLVLACLLCLSAVSPALAAGRDDTVSIDGTEAFLAFAGSCALDTWSQGKRFRLTADIDLTGLKFQGVPTFGGTFDGQGHKITGLDIGGSLSLAGLFGTVQPGGEVRNLTVTGMLAPSGTQEVLGGIAGINRGTVEHCGFIGTVRGASYIGGIAGRNEDSGVISGCTVSGVISGTHFTGGITGLNGGTVTGCVNNGAVNTDSVDESLSLGDIQIDWDRLRSTENLSAHTDTGGIAGGSSGTIEACVNNGAVGYPHVGYNVGGIAGRQSGYMSGCTNNGAVNGRKDVGGIVGQMTPDISLIFSRSDIQSLQGELDVLEGLIDKALVDAGSGSAEVSAEIATASEYLGGARESAAEIGGRLSGFADDNLEAAGELLETVRRHLGELPRVLEPLGDAASHTSDAFSGMGELVARAEALSDIAEDALLDLEAAAAQLRAAAGRFASGAASLRSAVNALKGDADLSAVQAELARLEADTAALVGALERLAGTIDAALTEYRETGALSPATLEALLTGAAEVLSRSGDVASDLLAVVKAIEWPQPGDLTERIRLSLGFLSQAMEHFRGGFAGIDACLGHLEAFLRDLGAANDGLAPVSAQFQTVLNTLASASASLSDAVSELGRWMNGVSGGDAAGFSGLGDGYAESSERLNAALTGLSGVVSSLNDKIGASSTALTQDMREINGQLVKVMNLMLEAVDSIGDADGGDYYEDISDDVIEQARAGKVSDCTNRGTVDGDVNIGGVTGSMAIEYDLDPEDDITTTGTRSRSFKYRTQSILLGCVNHAAVTAKKNCSGGMVGRMDLGTVSGCESYGPVSSTSGDYIGGIAGQSLSTIRKSSAKCVLSGRRYVAGIAGSGENIYDCYTMVKVRDDAQNAGAIAGEAVGTLSGNRFVSGELAGVDRISVAGRAEPVTYDELLAFEGLPERFGSLVITFVADGAVVDAVTIGYGDSLGAADIPAIPVRDGCYGVWDRADFADFVFDETVEAVYARYYSTLAGDLTREGGQPAVLVDGTFLREQSLTVTEGENGSLTVLIPDDGADTHLLRYMPADGSVEDTEIHLLSGGRWQKAQHDVLGSYLLFEAAGNEVTFKAAVPEAAAPVIYILLAVLAGAAVVLACVLRLRGGKRKKPSGNPPESPQTQER